MSLTDCVVCTLISDFGLRIAKKKEHCEFETQTTKMTSFTSENFFKKGQVIDCYRLTGGGFDQSINWPEFRCGDMKLE